MVYNKENIASFSIHKDNGKVFHCDKHCLPSESKQPETVKPFGPTFIFEGGGVVDPPPPNDFQYTLSVWLKFGVIVN